MAGPIHRFVISECISHRHCGPPPMPPVHARRAPEARRRSFYVEIRREPHTIASLAAAHSGTRDTWLRTTALRLHSPMMATHLKFGMLVFFALATVVLVCAKYYFDRQVVRNNSRGGEVNLVAAAVLLACVCSFGCALSLCRSPPAPPRTPDRVLSSTARRLPPALPTSPPEPAAQPEPAEPPAPEAPPPYHEALLLPPPSPPPSSPPPPAYSALS